MAYKRKEKQREYNRVYQKEVRSICKDRGICTSCMKAKAASGRTMCLDCLDYTKNEGEWSRSEESKAQRRKYMARKRELCIAMGICRECMKREATVGKKCGLCKAKERNKTVRKKEQREIMGLCTLCGGVRVDGYKVCQRCLDKCRSIVKNRKKADNSGHIWRRIQSGEVAFVKSWAAKHKGL